MVSSGVRPIAPVSQQLVVQSAEADAVGEFVRSVDGEPADVSRLHPHGVAAEIAVPAAHRAAALMGEEHVLPEAWVPSSAGHLIEDGSGRRRGHREVEPH